ncbi:MAG: hypothetical protein P4L90_08805 [Rhodopila sp.]|nr:hypothetical protein [Rhodopila sp.]
MRIPLAVILCIGCGIFAVSAHAQTRTIDADKLRSLKTQYAELSARYQEKCKLTDYQFGLTLLQIQQGAGLAGGVVFPMTMDIVIVLRNIQKQITDDMCERSKEYDDLARGIGSILDSDSDDAR